MTFFRSLELAHNSALAIVLNVIWFILGPGFLMALLYVLFSVSLFVTIVGIPFGWEILKLARLALWPFGYKVKTKETASKTLSLVLNVVWIIFGGFLLALLHLMLGIVWCVTIIGIPFGIQHFKMAKMAILPFGRKVTPVTRRVREKVPV